MSPVRPPARDPTRSRLHGAALFRKSGATIAELAQFDESGRPGQRHRNVVGDALRRAELRDAVAAAFLTCCFD